jgi:hypothetical protein
VACNQVNQVNQMNQVNQAKPPDNNANDGFVPKTDHLVSQALQAHIIA